MKVLVTARYVSGASREGGSSRFFRVVIDTLKTQGHEVTATNAPAPLARDRFDFIICSHHDQFEAIKKNPARKVYVSHGLIDDEIFFKGADRYVSVSEEVRAKNLWYGTDSDIVPQPIIIGKRNPPGEVLRKILIIRREPVSFDPFAFLSEKYELRYSDLERPIEDQIAWADLCIALGRGALESMAQGKPVLVADNRPYIGAYGDGYVTPGNVFEIARNNFSGRRFRYTLTREWIESELAKYDPEDSEALYEYVRERHEAGTVVREYLRLPAERPVIAFGCLVNDMCRLDMVLRQSEIEGKIHMVKSPEYATKGLNKLLGIAEEGGADVAVLTHQDMFYRQPWIDRVKLQLKALPESWIVAGIIGKDMEGEICGRFHDMRLPLLFNSDHRFPHPAACFDECCIIVNLQKGFRFDEALKGFDLYGTLAVLQAWEAGGTAWILDAFAEHYCMRPFSWYPGKDFEASFKWLHKRFKGAPRIDSTVIGVERKKLERKRVA
jgi:hypothetical protein